MKKGKKRMERQESVPGEQVRDWLRQWVELTSQRTVAQALGVNRDPLRKALKGTGEIRGVVRKAVEQYWVNHAIDTGQSEAVTGDDPDTADGGAGGSENAEDVTAHERAGQEQDDIGPSVNGVEQAQGATADKEETAGGVSGDDTDTSREKRDGGMGARRKKSEDGRDDAGADVGTGAARRSEQGDKRSDDGVAAAEDNSDSTDVRCGASLLDQIGSAEEPSELAALAGAPVLAEVLLEAARAGAQALARGWRWMRDSPPEGLHGDALFYLHTREEVHFADEGAKRVAFAPDTEMFECGLTGAELRYGVHPRQRQKRYAVERHEDRELLIGIRLAMLVPEKPYPDEKWFFGSEGSVIEGEWQPGAAEVIAARRKLLAMAACFPEDIAGKRPTRWQLALSNERMRVELTMINRHYRLTIGEHVKGDRTWAPSTRLGIETRWREAGIALNEAEIEQRRRHRRRIAALLRLPRLPGRIARRVIFGLRRGLAEYGLPELIDPENAESGVWCRRLRETVLPSLHEWTEEQEYGEVPTRQTQGRWTTRMLKRFLYPHEYRLSERVCGERNWTIDAPSWSEEYRRFWRPHEFDEDYDPPEAPDGSKPVNWTARLLRKVRLTRKRAA